MDLTLGRWLKQLRQSAGLSQTELAEKAGTDLATLRALERDDVDPSAAMILALARALRIRPSDLLEPHHHSHVPVMLIRRHQNDTIYTGED